jgi:outer membrane murein-binding lipoprotein Lpp
MPQFKQTLGCLVGAALLLSGCSSPKKHDRSQSKSAAAAPTSEDAKTPAKDTDNANLSPESTKTAEPEKAKTSDLEKK